MEVIVLPEADGVAALAADIIEQTVRDEPTAVLGVATGSSPLGAYRELIRRHRDGSGPSYDGVQVFTLDEYVGLPVGDPQSYRATIARELTDPLGIDPARVHGPDATPEGLATAGERYERAIGEAGGVDLQLLGIGTDGHLAFNEPGSSFASRTRLKTLAEPTRRDNARFFGRLEDVPIHALTQGLGTILDARRLLLLAVGDAKAGAVADAVEGPLTASCPASALQLHNHATVILDEAAASRLRRREYYAATWQHKPSWQRLT